MYAMRHLLFVHSALVAQRFDLTSCFDRPPCRSSIAIRMSMDTPPRFGICSASQTGRLAYLPDGGGQVPMTILANWAALLK